MARLLGLIMKTSSSKKGVKYKTTYYRNGVNSNPTMTAQSYQADVFSPPQH